MEATTTSVAGVDFGRAHFLAFADLSLLFEFVYYVPSSGYDHALDLQHRVNLALLRRFEQEAISFAYPSQTLHPNQA